MGCLMKVIKAPFQLFFFLLKTLLDACGRVLSLILGALICAFGVLCCATLLGAALGIPLVIFGGGLMLKAIFR